MSKHALCGVAAAIAVASLVAVTAARAAHRSAQAPRREGKALRILRADVTKIARDFAHKRYAAVCADLTKKEYAHFGGSSTCVYKVELVHLLVPIKTFTITAVKLNRSHTQASISFYVNGDKQHRIHAVAQWENGAYRLAHESGWKPF